MASGFHLLDSEESEITYVNFWTCGKNGDVSTHNHAQDPSPVAPAFAEVHLVLNNGTGTAGMYETESPDSDVRDAHIMRRATNTARFLNITAVPLCYWTTVRSNIPGTGGKVATTTRSGNLMISSPHLKLARIMW
ncbi:MAG: hypothetical protein ACNYPE_12340 [Candidatus Azotimanducaceae bacterium WSBS_2022_MAG_OTU7]